MIVQIAHLDDFLPWLDLAREVEDLFGPMVRQPGFEETLRKNILGGTAVCIRQDNGPLDVGILQLLTCGGAGGHRLTGVLRLRSARQAGCCPVIHSSAAWR